MTSIAVPRRFRPRRPRPRLLALGGVLLVGAAAALAVWWPLGGSGGSGTVDNGTSTALATVERRSLTSQTEVSGTLGYAGADTIAVPSGTGPSALRQAEQAAATARATLAGAETTATADGRALVTARATLVADRRRQAVVCGGTGAASPASSAGDAGGGGGASSPCVAAVSAVAAALQAELAAQQKSTADASQVESARIASAGAEQALATARSSATLADTGATSAGATFTMLPTAGQVVNRGQALYGVDGAPVVLLYGATPAFRAFRAGMSPGRDVAELNANLQALGFANAALAGDAFTDSTERAVLAYQAAHGLDQTGELPLGSVVFEPGAVRVQTVVPTVGATVQPGAVLTTTSTRHQVVVEIDAAQQGQAVVGDRVEITLPDQRTVAGVVAKVGKVATVPTGGDGSDQSPTIEVDIRIFDQAAAGQLDQAPVNISVTTGSVRNALVVPVSSLLALAGGGYAVEVAEPSGTHRLVGVGLGLFDDADGLVQVTGTELRAGQRIVVPST
jgi:peptidoglycan hydrolase-like protein with peptidoglycan-binding domain